MTKTTDNSILSDVLAAYGYALEQCTVTPLGNGHINTTYLVQHKQEFFVLQKINHHVFKRPEVVVNNAQLINEYLAGQQASGLYALASIRQVSNQAGRVLTEIKGEYWRIMSYIADSYTLESVENSEDALNTASAFANFSAALSNFPAESLTEVIPKFHDIRHRMQQLEEAVEENPSDRLKNCRELVQFCQQQQDFVDQVVEITKGLPLHVTHNDTKINNLLFSRQEKRPIAVIDLDTCMPGYLMHDFGDMVRTCCSNLAEDATNIEQMRVRMDIFSALAKGYLGSLAGKISEQEKESLVLGAKLLPLMIGVRFLTDYLDGDNYFQVHHDNQNLERARNQIRLYQLLRESEDRLREIILSS